MKKNCDIKNTSECAGDIAAILLSGRQEKRATVIGLKGDLGSGKTTFTKALAKKLGVADTVLSPTFVIEKIYKLPAGKPFRHLIHIDAYRLDSAEELRALGWDEILSEPKNLIVIEWPERVKKLLPKGSFEVKFKFIDDRTREISWK
ncbi:MAG: tRNA (adenosine(37)-N6)-threonylcarbamoyltransferase complex ATPase subunit type 1 TsaE [Candidatus Paceibacterota bacterium]|jgi:tRNA threonylcarbamoyladenosine biosynthesis protein TsaE